MKDLPAPLASDIADLKLWISQAEQMLQPCPKDKIVTMLAGLSAALPFNRGNDEENRAKLVIYRENLCDIPQDILSEALRACVRTLKFFPTIAEIRKHASLELARRRFLLSRAKHYVTVPPAPPQTDLVSPEKLDALIRSIGGSEA